MDINDRIFNLLTEQGKTARDFGEYIGVKPSSISAWKNENSYPSSKYIVRISEFLGVSPTYLFTGVNDNTNVQKSSLLVDEEELLNNYRKLDSRRQHHIQLLVYDEVDEQDKERRLRAGESYESVFGPSQEEPRPTRPPSKLPCIPFVAKGGDKISDEDDQMIQEKLRAMEERSRMIREKRKD